MNSSATRIAIAVNQPNLTVTVNGEQVTITGRIDHIDSLVDRVADIPPAEPCDNQLSLFDATEFETCPRLQIAS
jgi:hypothetical protein